VGVDEIADFVRLDIICYEVRGIRYEVFDVGYVIWYRSKCLCIYKCNINYFNFRDIINITFLCNYMDYNDYEDKDADEADDDEEEAFCVLNSAHEIFFTAGGFE
jgi:hypothetical protein